MRSTRSTMAAAVAVCTVPVLVVIAAARFTVFVTFAIALGALVVVASVAWAARPLDATERELRQTGG